MQRTDLAIVGAGPAGLAAAVAAADLGVRVTVLDEQAAPGGQIYRQPPSTYQVGGGAKGPGFELREQAQRHPNIRFQLGTTTWGVMKGLALALNTPRGTSMLQADAVLVAAGAYDRPVAFAGWTLPGVMTAGGVQAFVKSQQLLPGRRILLAGAHPLQLVVGAQLVKAGAQVEAILFAQHLHPLELLREAAGVWGHWSKLKEAYDAWATLWRASVPIRYGEAIRSAVGSEQVEGAVIGKVDHNWHAIAGSEYQVPVDTIALGYGFVPSVELARQAGAAVRWAPEQGGWVCEHDSDMQSTVPGLYVAGEVTGVAGADVAIAEGRIAGLSVARHLGLLSPKEAERRLGPLRRALWHQQRFAGVLHRLFAPKDGLSELMADDVVICRCEGKTAGELRQALAAQPHITDVNALKLYTRCGMGLCQGRLCGGSAASLIAEARGCSPAEAGSFTARPPVKPIPIRSLVEQVEIDSPA